MAGILPSMKLTGPSPIDEPRRDSAVRLPLRNTVAELLLGTVVAVVVSMLLQFAAARLSISEPSFAPEALAAVGSGVVLAVLFLALALGHRRSPRWLRLFGSWVALSAFSTLALAIPLQATRFYYGGSSVDNGFRMQYMTRMASTPGLADMNYADTPPYYPGGWFWLGGRFANLLGWEGWAAYKPYALT
ncbi:galactan 5-O-arabinofuranosyltransferase [Saccharopolyspora kobensis]|nr:galactan 5-O-arabinofuranosyltransferase [Saccharopolyspora kobensis]